ncbi:class F sortase [Geodermatophilus sp. SYSU D00758]
MRITGVYPPPLPPREGGAADPVAALLARPPRVARYERRSRPRPRAARAWAARAWAAASVTLAATGVAALVLLPSQAPVSARVDAPVATSPAPAPAPAAVPAPVTRSPSELPASTPVGIRIPALGTSSEVMRLGLERDGSLEVPPGAFPVGWYEGSPTPGARGPAVLAGHVDWDGERGAFHGLRELRGGDAVLVDRADGTTATFVVERVEEHPKDRFPGDAVYGDLDHAGLRLITCGGSFDQETGDYRDNVIVFARLAG